MKSLKKEVSKATQKARVEYEARLQQVQAYNAILKTKVDRQNTQLSQYEDQLKQAQAREEEYHHEIEATTQAIKAEHDRVRRLYAHMAEALDDMPEKMKGQEQALKSKEDEISMLKAMDPFDRSRGEVQKSNQRITTILTSLGAMGQEIYKKRLVSATLTLVGGNVTVAMIQYGVNITHLDAQHFQILLNNGNCTTKEFLIFLVLSQKIQLVSPILLTR